MPDYSAAISLLAKPIEDLYSMATGAIKHKISLMKAKDRMDLLHKRLYESQRVKTIWHTERPLSLNSFYYPVHISGLNKFSKNQRFKKLSDLPDNNNIILGTVGQGKSILTRYLLGQEIKSGTHIPLLIELRNVGESHLLDFILDRFSILLGVEKDFEVFETFAKNGKISFLLDGFDEIDAQQTARSMQEIEDLAFIYPDCRILVTSRPESDCQHLSSFYTYNIEPLNENDYFPFYKKILTDDETAKRIVAAISASPTKIKQTIKTPLLATLLAISYRNSQRIPLDFSGFYDDIFQILLDRHDASKKGWKRTRSSELDDRQIQQVFEAFCFATRKIHTSVIEQDVAYSLIEQSARDADVVVNPLDLLKDIKKITCLLIDEGNKTSFVHTNVQEFFAARYIKTKTESVASRFYEQLSTSKWRQWAEEILFLRQIDSFRIQKYFLLPDIKATLTHLHEGNNGSHGFAAIRYLSGIIVRKRELPRNGKMIQYFIETTRPIDSYHYNQIDIRMHSHLFKTSIIDWKAGFKNNPTSEKRSYLQIAKDRGDEFFSETIKITEAIIHDLIQNESIMRQYITKNETRTSFISI